MEKELKNNYYPPLHIKAGDYPVCVFRVASSPRLKVNSSPATRPGTIRRLHTHFTYEVFFVVSGTLTLMTQAEQSVYERSVVIIPPRIHHVSIRDGESYCLLFSFDGESTIARWLERGVCVLPLSDETVFYIRQLTEKTLARTDADEQAAQYLASLIFFDIFRTVKPDGRRANSRKNRTAQHIGAIDEFINRNLDQKLTLEDLSAAIHLSKKQISRIIRQEYHCSFPSLLNSKRLANAVLLLKSTDMSIEQIIAATFCNSPNYFYAVFREAYGMSPLQYRKESREPPVRLM